MGVFAILKIVIAEVIMPKSASNILGLGLVVKLMGTAKGRRSGLHT